VVGFRFLLIPKIGPIPTRATPGFNGIPLGLVALWYSRHSR